MIVGCSSACSSMITRARPHRDDWASAGMSRSSPTCCAPRVASTSRGAWPAPSSPPSALMRWSTGIQPSSCAVRSCPGSASGGSDPSRLHAYTTPAHGADRAPRTSARSAATSSGRPASISYRVGCSRRYCGPTPTVTHSAPLASNRVRRLSHTPPWSANSSHHPVAALTEAGELVVPWSASRQPT